MGVGKSSVARHLAMLLKCDRIDLDSFIEDNEHRKIHDIIDTEGLSFYREVETRNLERALTIDDAQILSACGPPASAAAAVEEWRRSGARAPAAPPAGALRRSPADRAERPPGPPCR
jgi:shikimate kinase